MKLPSIKELSALVRHVKACGIADEYRAFEDDMVPGVQLTVGLNDAGEWSWQTGDNSFTGGAYGYPYWAVTGVYRRSNSRAVARDLQDQLVEAMPC